MMRGIESSMLPGGTGTTNLTARRGKSVCAIGGCRRYGDKRGGEQGQS